MPCRIFIFIQFVKEHSTLIYKVCDLVLFGDGIPVAFCIIMVLLCEIISCYGYITVINVVRIIQPLCRCPVCCMVVFFRQISCRVIAVSYNVLFTMQFRQLISVIIQIPFCSAIRAFGNPVPRQIITTCPASTSLHIYYRKYRFAIICFLIT